MGLLWEWVICIAEAELIRQENGNLIYEARFDKSTNLKIKANSVSRYKVIIINQSVNPVTYKINISLWREE